MKLKDFTANCGEEYPPLNYSYQMGAGQILKED